MRETRVAQASIFEIYAEHEFSDQLNALSSLLDDHPEILTLIERDLIDQTVNNVGCSGMTVETIFRSMLLKQQLGVSYQQLAFHLADSMSYRSFVRLADGKCPKKSSLQSTIRRIKPETLEQVHQLLANSWLESGTLSMDQLRIDSTVVKSNIAPPSDSQLINDGVRVLSRNLAKSRSKTGKKIRFTDKRKASNSLAFRIFNAKKAEKEVLYEDHVKLTNVVLKQAERGLLQVRATGKRTASSEQWCREVEHYKGLLERVLNQIVRRVFLGEKVPSAEKVVSIFEVHTDVIVKGARETLYGHKINLSSEKHGVITHLSIEDGNPSDKELFIPVLEAHQANYNELPETVVGDGGYASQVNVHNGRALCVKRVVFHKKVGLSLHAMGVKHKTFERLRHFRAGIEGNISELKRRFGLDKAKWKGHEGFKAFVWSSVICYNLVRVARLHSD